jgi:hypothetical protein
MASKVRWSIGIDEAAPKIAAAMVEVVRQYPGSPVPLKNHYRTILKAMARDLENFVRPRASVAALEKAREMELPDIRQFHWCDQKGKMRDPHRSIFHWEHIMPVENIVSGVLGEVSIEGIARVLMTAEIAWILKEENERLTHKGRVDPVEDYRQAGIVLA